LHQRVKVESRMRDDYQRSLGNVSHGGQDLGRWMVSRGHAWSYRFRRDPGPYAREEAQARKARLGLWSGEAPVRPRDFRQRHGSCSMD
jgi:endonuclease YncB( thermonuclease family)